MKVNIYYGGRGLIEDPTLYVIQRITQVLEELRVEVKRYNLYEEKNNINILPKTFKEVDGIILATTVEWLGIGGYMQQFLDACWLYGNKEKISNTYMLPVVMATAYGEKEGELKLAQAWEILGGIPIEGISSYVEDHVSFEINVDYGKIIEKKAENLYRSINQKMKVLPTSNNTVKKNILRTRTIDLTPQESEQLSIYVSDDNYVKKQKEDIDELTQMFQEMLGSKKEEGNVEFIRNFQDNFHPQEGFSAVYFIHISDTEQNLILEVKEKDLKCYYGEKKEADVTSKTSHHIIKEIVRGKITFQKAFMSGQITAKGNFKTLRMFDTIFQFNIL